MDLQRIFTTYNKKRDGKMAKHEFVKMFQALDKKVSKEEIIEAFNLIDEDRSGTIEYEQLSKFYNIIANKLQ